MTVFILLLALSLGYVEGRKWSDGLEKPEIEPRITDGYPTKPGRHTYQVWFKYKNAYQCGGTLMEVYGIQVILTATHCVWEGTPNPHSLYPASTLTVCAGDWNLTGVDGTEQFREVAKVVEYEHYIPETYEHDITLFFLKEEFELNDHVTTATLPGYGWDRPEPDVIITGWGAEKYGGPLHDIMQRADVPVVSHDLCEQYEAVGVKITDNMLCVGVVEKALDDNFGPCLGDSGGPGVGYNESSKEYYIAGIVSFQMTRVCGSPYYPSILTLVSRYTDWIRIEVSKYMEENNIKPPPGDR